MCVMERQGNNFSFAKAKSHKNFPNSFEPSESTAAQNKGM